MDYKEFADLRYNEIFDTEYIRSLHGKNSQSAKTSAERKAQHEAMLITFSEAYDQFSDIQNATDIWNAIYSAHMKRKAGKFDSSDLNEEVIERIISGAQSWKKSSGHVFEHFVVDYTRERLRRYNIQFLLQKELTNLLHEGRIKNDSDDMIEKMVRSEDFDAYAVVDVNHNLIVFGCIQIKTSIRDRVGRDVSFSIPAMERNFWSIAVVLDGTYLAMPKFKMMVNGGGDTKYQENGWHGMYTMSNITTDDRIYMDRKLDLMIEHANEAAQKFTSSRQRFNQYWKAAKSCIDKR